MDPKRTDYSLTKPTRTSFSLGMDDYAAKTRGVSRSATPVQSQTTQEPAQSNPQPNTQTVVVSDKPSLEPQDSFNSPASSSNRVDGFSAQIKPKAAVQPAKLKPNFKALINQMLNSGLHNPGYLPMVASITAIKGLLARPQSPNLNPVTTVIHANPSDAEALEVGKFMVDHVDENARAVTAPQALDPVVATVASDPASTQIELAAASLASDARLNQKPSTPRLKQLGAVEQLKNLKLVAKNNRHRIRAIVAGAVACGIIMVSGGLMYANSKNLPEGSISGSTSLYVNTTTPEPTAPEPAATDENSLQPNRLKISSIGVDAPSVVVGLTRDNAVDVPEKISDAAWFNGSALPGKPGTTFMLGHYAAGYGGIFDNLAKIKEGDLVEVTDHAGTVFKYKVAKKDKQKVADINMDNLLSSQGENRLVIMTCAGSYIAQNYTDRFIVTATPIQ